MNMHQGGQSLDITKVPTKQTVELKPRKSLLNKNGTISSNGFDTKFYQRRDTLTFYKPAQVITQGTTFHGSMTSRIISPDRGDQLSNWASNAKTTSLLQNTPVVSHVHKTSFLQSKR